jgi:hypothetical protein
MFGTRNDATSRRQWWFERQDLPEYVRRELDWYDRHVAFNQQALWAVNGATLVTTSAIPVAVALGATPGVTAVLGAVATVLGGLRSLGRWEENRVAWAQSRAAIESEIVHFDVKVEPYRNPATAATTLTLNVEQIVSRETSAWAARHGPPEAPASPVKGD